MRFPANLLTELKSILALPILCAFYSSIGLSFVPLVASTFGALHEDFLRFLWLLSQPDQDHDLAVGEIREAGPSTPLRQLLFAKLRARASLAAAYAAAMRLLAIPLDRHPLPSSTSYVAFQEWNCGYRDR